MERKDHAKHLMAIFLEELHDRVSAMVDDLLALEKNPSDPARTEHLRSLFRSAHSLKGAARMVNVELLETACHHLEEFLSAVRDERWTLTPANYSLLLKTADAMGDVGMRLRDDQSLTGAPLRGLLGELQLAAEAPPAKASPAKASSKGTDEPAAMRNVADDTAKSASEMASPAAPTGSVLAAEAAEKSGSDADSEEADSAEADSAEADSADTNGADTNGAVADGAEANGADEDGAETAAPASPEAEGRRSGGGLSATIRVAAEKLDRLLAQSGELLVARRRVEQRSSDVHRVHDSVAGWRSEWQAVERLLRRMQSDAEKSGDPSPLTALPKRAAATLLQTGERLRLLEKELDQLTANVIGDGRLLGHACHALEDEVYSVRMLPFSEVCNGLERAVRDVARATGKDAALKILGEKVEVDRSVLEGLRDPLLHLVRNAVDHGIESPEQRAAAGKPPQASIIVSAELRGGNVEVAVSDDGRGFDIERIRAKVRQRGLTEPASLRDLARMVFLPGFSTAPIVTDISGRGVGLDVVRSQIESLHGAADVEFEAGVGTRFTLNVPLTLTTIRCILVAAGEETFAIPTSSVERLVRIDVDSIRAVGGRDTLLLGGQPIPLTSLASTFGGEGPSPRDRKGKLLATVLNSGEHRVAFLVDEVIAEQEVLVKSLGRRIRRIRHVSGATILPSGEVALVLNVSRLLRTALDGGEARRISLPAGQSNREQRTRLLVVDDSVTTRTLIKSILETEGYDVVVAADGAQAWELLSTQDVDLVVSDVDMPRLDGFELTRKIRGSHSLSALPVVLVTSRGSEQDKAQGVQAGAHAYLVKSSFDQRNLIETLKQLL